MAKSPMVESAYKVLEEVKTALVFQELWDLILEDLEIDKSSATNRIAKLYSDLTLDKRFISLSDNKWDLKKRHKVTEVLKEVDDILELDDEDEEYIDYDDLGELDDSYDDVDDSDDFDELKIDKDEYDEDIKQLSKLASLSEDEE